MNGALPPADLLRSAGAPHPAAEPDSSRLVYPTRLSIPQTWLYGLVEHPPLVVENLCGTCTGHVSALPARRNPDSRFGQETDAGPTELPLWMDRRGDHDSGNVRRGHGHVCCVDCRSRCRAAPSPDTHGHSQNCAFWTSETILSEPMLYPSGDESRREGVLAFRRETIEYDSHYQ